MTFTALCQKVIDAWVAAPTEPRATPDFFYIPIMSDVSFRMRVSTVDISGNDPLDWELKAIKHSRLASRLLNLDVIFRGGRLGDLADQLYLARSVLPQYKLVIEKRQPLIDTVETKLVGIRVVYDRLIVPEKCGEADEPSWLLVLTFGRFMVNELDESMVIDPVEESILIHLADGCSIKEIGEAVHLSPRTVEHRLERLKTRYNAKSLPHLSALFVAAGLARSLEPTRRSRRRP